MADTATVAAFACGTEVLLQRRRPAWALTLMLANGFS